MKKRIFGILSAAAAAFVLCIIFAVSSSAAEAEITGTVTSAIGVDAPTLLTDGDTVSPVTVSTGGSVTVGCGDGIGSLYIVFDKIPGKWSLTSPDGRQAVRGENLFLHEFVDVSQLIGPSASELTLTFPNGAAIAEIYVFGNGDVPDWVQRWKTPLERADLLMFSSHSDDEQLFFAGVLPYYAGEMGLDVQVVYVINHFDTHERPHEQLNGLWTVGVRNYPIISDFPDLYSESREGALAAFSAAGVEYDDFVEYITDNIRRFKPLVVVSHDLNGEYGHGTHILCASAICDALNISNDASVYPESAAEYGLWTPEKVYLHLYPKAQITMNFDRPLDHFGGKSAFQVTQDGFACHKSQHWTWFNDWIYGTADTPITRADQIATYSPMYYGLYYTSVGADVVGGDFFENVKPYAKRTPETDDVTESSDSTAAVTDGISDTTDNSDRVSTVESNNTHFAGVFGSSLSFTVIIILIIAAVLVCTAMLYIGTVWTRSRKRPRRR